MHGLGAATVGASTLPEQIATFHSGMRRVIISSATSPSAGMSSEQIDGEEVLIGGSKCVANFARVIPKLVAKLDDSFFPPRKPLNILQRVAEAPMQDFKLTRVDSGLDTQTEGNKLASAIRAKVGESVEIGRVIWLMS